MCGTACLEFGARVLSAEDVCGRDVLEVGATDVNGSLRPQVESLRPTRYVGVDLAPGRGVDEVCRAENLIERYGAQAFDVVIATELLEHVEDWRRVVSNLKRVLKPGGVLLITTRSRGFPYHAHPYDFWRYEIEDARAIFSDLEVEALENDPVEPGLFLKARKPAAIREADLLGLALYSILLGRRVRSVGGCAKAWFRAKHFVWSRARKVVHRKYRTGILGKIT